MLHFAALVLPGTFMSSLAMLTDAFYIAQERRERTIGSDTGGVPDFRLSLISLDGNDVAIGTHGTVRIDQPISRADSFDFIWIPAFRAYGEAALRRRLSESAIAIEWLRHAADNGTLIAASGAAVTLPMAARLADQLTIPVAAPLLPLVRALFPRFHHGADLIVANHGSLLLSRGIAHDAQVMTTAFASIFSPATGRWLRSVFGSDTIMDLAFEQAEARDPLVANVRLMLEQRFSLKVSVSALAEEVSVSHAVLIRRFRKVMGMTPSDYVRKLRLEAAQRMLVQSDRPIDSVAASTGFRDARVFRQMFRQATGQSASAWRKAAREGSLAAGAGTGTPRDAVGPNRKL